MEYTLKNTKNNRIILTIIRIINKQMSRRIGQYGKQKMK